MTTSHAHHLTTTLALATLSAAAALSHAGAGLAVDACDPMNEVDLAWPHHTVCHLGIRPTNIPGSDIDCDGFADGFVGSGVLVNHCTVLTCAHVFFNRKSRDLACTRPGTNFDFLMADASDCIVTPAAIRWGSPGSGRMLGPLGQFKAGQVGVDERYTRSGNLRHMRNDIGYARLREGVWHLRTFMALQVGGLSGTASDLHVAGYSPAFNAAGESFSNLHKGIAPSPWGDTGFHNYGVDTHGGISGGPQWDSRTNRIVGIHAYDMGPFCAGGPRFGGANKSIAEAIFAMSCSDGANDDDQFESMPWDALLQKTIVDPDVRIEMDELRLVNGIDNWPHAPMRRVFQVIENTTYEWYEYDLIDPFDTRPLQMVRMVQPQQKWLDATEAQGLLSASRNWGVKYSQLPPQDAWQGYEVLGTSELEETLDGFPEADDDDADGQFDFTVLEGTPDDAIEGDIDGDGQVGGADLAGLLGTWGQVGSPEQASCDINGDGVVDGVDLAKLLANWTD
jgi:hypothetical protein